MGMSLSGNRRKGSDLKNYKMNKDWEINLWERLKERRIKKLKENKILNKNYKEMSLVERNAYEQIVDRKGFYWNGLVLTKFLIGIFAFIFFIGIGGIYFYGNGVFNFREVFEPIFNLFLNAIWKIFLLDIFLMFIITFFNEFSQIRLRKKLLLNKDRIKSGERV